MYFHASRKNLLEQMHLIGMSSPGPLIHNTKLTVAELLKLEGERLSLTPTIIKQRIDFFIK